MAEYAAAAIPEYWIVDPQSRTLSMFVLADGGYQPAELSYAAVSRVMPGLNVDVADLFIEAAKRA
jgi:Uma2 family endonuclease